MRYGMINNRHRRSPKPEAELKLKPNNEAGNGNRMPILLCVVELTSQRAFIVVCGCGVVVVS